MICVDLIGYDVVRFGSDFGQILVRFLGKIGQIVSPIFGILVRFRNYLHCVMVHLFI